MDNHWATEHLHVIRTLMERSALYRRALAPIMLASGAIGLGGTLAARFVPAGTPRGFTLFWMAVGIVTLGLSLLLVRRQALKDAEPFWSLPTRRVAGGLFPCFLAGLAVAVVSLQKPDLLPPGLLASLWILNYGGALQAAGSFMERGIKLFGGAFLLGGVLLLVSYPACPWLQGPSAGHLLMGGFFGGLHLAYGAYLYFTERKSAS